MDSSVDSDEPNRAPVVIRTLWILLSLSTVVVIARLFVKIRALRRLFWDDFFIILAWVFGLVHAILTTIACNLGVGKPIEVVYISGVLHKTLKIGYMTLAWGFLSPMAGRIAFCFFMLWVAGTDPKVKRWPFYLAIFIQLVFNLAQLVVAYAQCGTRVHLIWEAQPEEQAKYCWSTKVQSDYAYVSGSVNTATDIFLAIMPAIIIYRSQTSKKKMLTLASFLCLSCIAMIASIVKTVESKFLSSQVDYTYDLIMYVIWISIELNVVMIVSSIPIIRPLLSRNGLNLIIRTISRNRNSIVTSRLSRSGGGGAGASRHRKPDESWHAAISMSRTAGRTGTSSIASEEELSTSASNYSPHSHDESLGGKEMSIGDQGIVRTVEVKTEVSNAKDVAVAHAALVGLVL